MDRLRVLVLCTGNSCRSILAEVLFRELGEGRVEAFSAGSKPAGAVNPGALEKLEAAGHSTAGVSSKSWDRFSGSAAQPIDVVVTVCDNAAGESCPVWSGAPVTVHWGIEDPADAPPGEARAAFDLAYNRLRSRVEAMLALPIEKLAGDELRAKLSAIHVTATAVESRGE